MRLISLLLLASWTVASAAEAPAKTEPKAEPPAKEEPQETPAPPVVRDASVVIAGKTIPYRITAAKLQLKRDDGKPSASIFHVSYERKDAPDLAKRPVLFAFNGGPGSSSVWLHLGMLGPKRIDLPADGTAAPAPPSRVVDNPESILDVCDLVFIDPVSTGYSRADKDTKADDFHGVEEDISSVGDFIRRWTTEHGRWASPKFLLGESYGGIRAAGLADHLQSRFGMNLNGVVLLSSLLDFRTLSADAADPLPDLVYLPAYTATALYHGRLQGDAEAKIAEARAFAFGEYATALLQGSELPAGRKQELAAKLAAFTGIEPAVWLAHDLRLDPAFFRAELLRKDGKVVGRFEARVAWESGDPAAATAGYDPSYSLAFGAFSTALLDYLGRDLGWKEDQPYEILTRKVQPWRWNADNGYVNLSDRLAEAMRDNPRLKLLVMCGDRDLATPADGIAYSFRHLPGLPPALRANVGFSRYAGGHMFYLNPPDRAKTRADLVNFIQSACP